MAGPDTSTRYDSSAGELSSPQSVSLSDPPGSPSRRGAGPSSAAGGEIVVGSEPQPSGKGRRKWQHYNHDPQEPDMPKYERIQTTVTSTGYEIREALLNGEWIPITLSGQPRKKPGPKPKPRPSDAASESEPQQPKAKKPRKSRDPDAPPAQRKRKIALAADADDEAPSSRDHPHAVTHSGSAPSNRPQSSSSHNTAGPSTAMASSQYHGQGQSQHHNAPSDQRHSPKIPKRESGYPSSMQSILNVDPPAPPHSPNSPSTTIPVRSSGQSYDPIRGNYDPVRETMVSHSQYQSATGSPRATGAQPPYRSPSIASMIETKDPAGASPRPSLSLFQPPSSKSRLHVPEPSSMPPSPTHSAARPTSNPSAVSDAQSKDFKKETSAPAAAVTKPVIKESNFTTIANGPIRKTADKAKTSTGVSTPLTDSMDDVTAEGGRSILDFGKARPGEEAQATTIVLNIPIKTGETNKYVNFMRLAEDRYGWDVLHPRLAANRDRKARIAAAAASLEKTESGRESGDEMSVDLSDAEGSNQENGAASGPDAQVKPKKKRNFKEDQYDVDDDFVDDSEMLWEAQAAASRDGFFVYSGPLVPEPEKPAAGHEERPKRGRGGGRGSRGGGRGRGGTGTGRGGGPGSRGGVARKPRITKSEKAQREREKAERENVGKSATNGHGPTSTPAFTVSELGA